MLNAKTKRSKLVEIALRRRGAIYVDNNKNESPLSTEDLGKFTGSLCDLGYYVDVLDKNITEQLRNMSKEDVEYFLEVAKLQNNFNTKTMPLYKNFPTGVENTPEVCLFIDAVYYALTGFKKTFFEEDPKYQRTMEEYESNKKLRKLTFANKDIFKEIFFNLIGRKTAPSETDRSDIVFLLNYLVETGEVNNINLNEVPFREIKIILLNEFYKMGVLLNVERGTKTSLTTTDILRLLQYFEENKCDLHPRFLLPSKSKLFSLSDTIEHLLTLTNAMDGHYEDMKRYKEEWKHIFRNMDKEYKTRLIVDIEDHLYGNYGKKISTWGGKEEELYLKLKSMADKDKAVDKGLMEEYLGLFESRPSELLRRVDKLLMLEGVDEEQMINAVYKAVVNGELRVAIQLYNYLNRRNDARVSNFGTQSRMLELKGEYPNIDIEDIKLAIRFGIKVNLVNKLNEKDEKLKILYNPDVLKNVAVSTSDRNNGKNFLGLTTGSKIELGNHRYLRLFTKWEGENKYTDIDLAAIAVSGMHYSAGELLEKPDLINNRTCAYYDLKPKYMTHSGDVRTDNGEEYIDVDIDGLVADGYEGIIVRNTNYTGSTMPTIKTGVMVLEKENRDKGSVFKDKDVLFSSECEGDVSASIAFYLDLKTMTVHWIDRPLSEGMMSAYDRNNMTKVKNNATVKQEIGERLMVLNLLDAIEGSKNVELVTPEEYSEMSDEEKEEVVVLAERRGDDYIAYTDRITKLFLS